MLKLIKWAVFLLIILIVVGSINDSKDDPISNQAEVTVSEIIVNGEDVTTGLADPSIEYGADSTGWMAYSHMNTIKNHLYVETHLARSDNSGDTWEYVTDLNETKNDEAKQGIWKNETSSLVFDPGDIPSRQWKIFYATWFLPYEKVNGNLTFEHSSVRYKTAGSPDGVWSEEVCLFGNKDEGCQQEFSELDPSLENMVLMNELGSIAVKGTLYMSADVSPSNTGLGTIDEIKARKIVLLSSKDHGITWRFVNTLTDFDDASSLNYFVFTASSLVEKDGVQFLMFTPSGAMNKKDKNHDGVYVVEFEDISKGLLKRDKGGKPLFSEILGEFIENGGLADYHEKNTAGGVVGSNFYVEGLFKLKSRLFSTQKGID
ncbi:hypothetical protein KC865_04205 [Candidatus Kaiserbacteria bacterium]|nr:hypothetical protein [Candidatus Kaiserbacteria bacterium]USN92013.1 MAG: hypothetical protein H6782_04005 [Candidatus Nomurabacteria bacterium]